MSDNGEIHIQGKDLVEGLITAALNTIPEATRTQREPEYRTALTRLANTAYRIPRWSNLSVTAHTAEIITQPTQPTIMAPTDAPYIHNWRNWRPRNLRNQQDGILNMQQLEGQLKLQWVTRHYTMFLSSSEHYPELHRIVGNEHFTELVYAPYGGYR